MKLIKKTWSKLRMIPFNLWCRLWNWRLPKDMDEHLENWLKIDHRKDKSFSGKDFRFYLYLREADLWLK